MNVITVERAIAEGIKPHQLEWCADWSAERREALGDDEVTKFQHYLKQEKELRKVAKAIARALKPKIPKEKMN